MPGRITGLSETQIIADLLREQRRQRTTIISQMPQPAKDTFTVASTPATTYQLNAIPYQGSGGSSLNLSLNGVELVEGVDYTCDYTTAIVTVTATLKGTPTPADVLTADYWTTGDLIAATGPVDTGAGAPTSMSHSSGSGNSTSPSSSMPGTFAAGDLLIAALSTAGPTVTVAPAGWTLATSTAFLWVYSKVATGSETTVGWTVSSAANWYVEVRAFRGTSGTPSIDTSGTGTQRLGSSAPAPVLTSTGTRLELGFWAVQKTGIVNSVSAPTGWTNAEFVTNAGTGALMAAEKSVSAGSTSADSATSSGAEDDWNMVALILNGPL